jgi:hypothetical protein
VDFLFECISKYFDIFLIFNVYFTSPNENIQLKYYFSSTILKTNLNHNKKKHTHAIAIIISPTDINMLIRTRLRTLSWPTEACIRSLGRYILFVVVVLSIKNITYRYKLKLYSLKVPWKSRQFKDFEKFESKDDDDILIPNHTTCGWRWQPRSIYTKWGWECKFPGHSKIRIYNLYTFWIPWIINFWIVSIPLLV